MASPVLQSQLATRFAQLQHTYVNDANSTVVFVNGNIYPSEYQTNADTGNTDAEAGNTNADDEQIDADGSISVIGSGYSPLVTLAPNLAQRDNSGPRYLIFSFGDLTRQTFPVVPAVHGVMLRRDLLRSRLMHKRDSNGIF